MIGGTVLGGAILGGAVFGGDVFGGEVMGHEMDGGMFGMIGGFLLVCLALLLLVGLVDFGEEMKFLYVGMAFVGGLFVAYQGAKYHEW